MQKKLGQALQTTGGLLTLLLAGASDMGHISAVTLALGLLAAALLVCAGQLVIRHRIIRLRMRDGLLHAIHPRRNMTASCCTSPSRI